MEDLKDKPVTYQDVLDQRFEPTNSDISIEDLKSVIGYDFKSIRIMLIDLTITCVD